MFDFLRKRSHCTGSALFRGNLSPRIHEFDKLEARGVTIEPGRDSPTAHWSAQLKHPEWGEAQVVCLKNAPSPSRRLLQFDPKLSDRDVGAIAACGNSVSLQMEGTSEFVLRDRKYMLRFLDALMGDDGVAAVDHTSGTCWTRDALEDELAHDADLDIESVFVIHAVGDENNDSVAWFHTHGLGELGRFDFDILQPGEEFVENCGDFCRAMAFAILEGHARSGMTAFEIGEPLFPMNLVPANEFMRQAVPEHRAVRDDPDGDHDSDRVVICDPPGGGLAGRLLGGSKLRPAKGFARGVPDGAVINFSSEATELMADRARKTYPVLRQVAEEMAEFDLPTLVKIGYAVDGGGPQEREHLWFLVHELRDDAVEATLVNSPYRIASMSEGDRGIHGIEQLTEWTILTPFGPIKPHAFHARRLIDDNRDELRQQLAAASAEST